MSQKNTAIQLIDKNQSRLEAVGLRKDLSFADWRNSALMAIESTDLRYCLDSVVGQRSLVYALTYAAITRLSLLPTLGYACIIPRKDRDGNTLATYQTEKAGLVKLALDAGYEVDSYRIRETDKVEIQHGQFTDRLVIEPKLTNRGPVIGYAAKATRTRTQKDTPVVRVHYMDLDEVLDHAVKHASSNDVQMLLSHINRENNIDDELKAIMWSQNVKWNLKQANWIKSFHGMGEKTVVKALLAKPKFSDLLNIAANAEVAQDHIGEYDTGVITVEVQNKGAVDTQRELENQQRKVFAKNKQSGRQQQSGQQTEPPNQEDAPPPEEAPFD